MIRNRSFKLDLSKEMSKLAPYLNTAIATICLTMAFSSAVFADTTVESIQHAIDKKQYLAGKVKVESFENGMVTLSGWIKEGLELEAIGSTLRKVVGVERYSVVIVLIK